MKRAQEQNDSGNAGMLDWWKGKTLSCPAHLRARLERAVDDRHYREARFLAVLGVAITLVSLSVDLVTIPEHFALVAVLRLSVTVPFLLAVLAMPRERLALQKLFLGTGLTAMSLTLLFASGFAPPPADAFMAMGVAIMLGLTLPLLPFRRRGVLLFIAVVFVPAGFLVIYQQKVAGHAVTFLLILTLVATAAGILARRMRWLERRTILFALEAEDHVRELGMKNERLTELSTQDPLTGLANRRHASEVFQRHYSDESISDGRRAALLMIDIDHFKAFNDDWGHQAGDDCLRAVAEQLRVTAETHGGLAARFGGEEFVVFLSVTGIREAKSVAEDVRMAIERLEMPRADHDAIAICTTSVGIAVHEGKGIPDMRSLLGRADVALYRAKAAGRNRCVLAA